MNNQHLKIKSFLMNHGSISPMDAFSQLGITKLSTRIGEMVRNGEPIGRMMVHEDNGGKKVRYMRYYWEG